MTKLNTKAVKELMESGCEYDEAVRLVEDGVRLDRIEEKANRKRSKKREGSRRSPRAQK